MTLENNKKEIIELLRIVKREGMNDLIKWLEESDFFIAPSSTKYHLSCEGGLSHHSLSVFKLFKEKCERYKIDILAESIIICGLLHDVCKINFYKKNNEAWRKQKYVVEDKLPLGHGEKSIMTIQDFIKLNDQEKIIIRWHMGQFGLNKMDEMAFYNALKLYPECLLLHTADWESSVLLEE